MNSPDANSAVPADSQAGFPADSSAGVSAGFPAGVSARPHALLVRRWLDTTDADAQAFRALVDRPTLHESYPLAIAIDQRVPVYSGASIEAAQVAGGDTMRALLSEWIAVLAEGPGVFAIRGAVSDRAVLDRATEVFTAIIDEQNRSGSAQGDHFAKPGANDRIWNSLEKHAIADPSNFVHYFSSASLALPCAAWLGRGYQVTAQVNRVNPGGAAQVPHRDYHLGFMTSVEAADFPSHVHRVSPILTLQGAVAHCDMPVETGPTVYLPYSQLAPEGYVHFGRDDYQAVFADLHVQLELAAGDAVFFNPALMHGAGTNRTADVLRMANLLQVSSAFGRAMESVDRTAIVESVYPSLLSLQASGLLRAPNIANAVGASAEGYAFPTNLDRDVPVGGLAPATQADLVVAALAAGRSPDSLHDELLAWERRRQTR